MRKTLFLILLLFPLMLCAQVTITGKVSSMVNKNPVPDASVFLSNASVGGKTGNDGTFTLNNVKNGQYDLVVSCVGYEAYHQTIMVNSADMSLPDIALMPKVTQLKEVTVTYDQYRERHLQQFKTELLGRSVNAMDCSITNIDIVNLQFDKATGRITADTDDFLIIENKALGYRIKYLLKSFEYDPRQGFVSYIGSSIFEPMKGKPGDEKRWAKKRAEAYLGSCMHFLRACIGMRADEEGFKVLRLIRQPNPARPPDSLIRAQIKYFSNFSKNNITLTDSLRYWSEKSRIPKTIATLVSTPLMMVDYIRLTEQKNIFAFGYTDCLQITYRNRESTTSVVTFHKPFAFFDSNGIILNPDSNFVEGYWGFQRLAELLPVDYELPLSVK